MIKNTKRTVTAISLLLLLPFLLLLPSYADSFDAGRIFDAILSFRLTGAGAASVQEWIDGDLSARAGSGGEWAVIALAQTDEGKKYDFSAYRASLVKYLNENNVASASSRQKFALTLCAVGGQSEPFVQKTMNDSIGELGIMSYVFGLHLINNGLTSEKHTAASVTAQLLALQHGDGGWSVMGDYGDVDVTAMVLSALAPQRERAETEEAIGKGLSFLSARQQDDGAYMSYGAKNCNSCAQVLTALSDLGVDPNDARFVKKGKTVTDGIMQFALSDGSFAYKEDGVYNNMATEQVFYATVAAKRAAEGKSPLFVLDAASAGQPEPTPTPTPETTPAETPTAPPTPETPEPTAVPTPETAEPTPVPQTPTVPSSPSKDTEKKNSSGGFYLIPFLVVLAFAAVPVVLQIRKRRNRR